MSTLEILMRKLLCVELYGICVFFQSANKLVRNGPSHYMTDLEGAQLERGRVQIRFSDY